MSSYLAAVEENDVRYSRMYHALEEIIEICRDPVIGKRRRFMNVIELADEIERKAVEAIG